MVKPKLPFCCLQATFKLPKGSLKVACKQQEGSLGLSQGPGLDAGLGVIVIGNHGSCGKYVVTNGEFIVT
jgi:hypothetical protein